MPETISLIQESLELIFSQPIPEDRAKRLYNWGKLSGFSKEKLGDFSFWLRLSLMNYELLSSFLKED